MIAHGKITCIDILNPAFNGSSLTYCGLLVPYCFGDLSNISSINGLLPDGTKPLPEPMLFIIRKVQWQSSEVNFNTRHEPSIKISLKIIYLKSHSNFSEISELMTEHSDKELVEADKAFVLTHAAHSCAPLTLFTKGWCNIIKSYFRA